MASVLKAIKIRGHHLLCIQGFQGDGYSQNFVDNMAQVIKQINSSPDLEIEITDKCDLICSPCPHNISRVCQKKPDSQEKVKGMDRRVLENLGLKRGTRIKAKDLLFLANMHLRKISVIQDICGNCEWKEKCLEKINAA